MNVDLQADIIRVATMLVASIDPWYPSKFVGARDLAAVKKLQLGDFDEEILSDVKKLCRQGPSHATLATMEAVKAIEAAREECLVQAVYLLWQAWRAILRCPRDEEAFRAATEALQKIKHLRSINPSPLGVIDDLIDIATATGLPLIFEEQR